MKRTRVRIPPWVMACLLLPACSGPAPSGVGDHLSTPAQNAMDALKAGDAEACARLVESYRQDPSKSERTVAVLALASTCTAAGSITEPLLEAAIKDGRWIQGHLIVEESVDSSENRVARAASCSRIAELIALKTQDLPKYAHELRGLNPDFSKSYGEKCIDLHIRKKFLESRHGS